MPIDAHHPGITNPFLDAVLFCNALSYPATILEIIGRAHTACKNQVVNWQLSWPQHMLNEGSSDRTRFIGLYER